MGRGGAGNIRSPSREVVKARPGELSSISETEQIEHEKSLIRNREVAREGHMVCPPCLVCRQIHEHTSVVALGGKRWRRKHDSPGRPVRDTLRV